ncbi:unnamed protein product, partial [Urochloa humidicola]
LVLSPPSTLYCAHTLPFSLSAASSPPTTPPFSAASSLLLPVSLSSWLCCRRPAWQYKKKNGGGEGMRQRRALTVMDGTAAPDRDPLENALYLDSNCCLKHVYLFITQ